MNHLTRQDHAAALRLLVMLEAAATSPERFVAAAEFALARYVGAQPCIVLQRGLAARAAASPARPREGVALKQDGRAAAEHAIAMPLCVEGDAVVSVVLRRRGADFHERDRQRLELLRPHLAFLYRAARCAAPHAGTAAVPLTLARNGNGNGIGPAPLTPRECEVVRWLAHGKTDREIAALLGTSPRTVQKHLEHVYVKLGVETRTAAVMRAFALRPPDGLAHPRV